MDLPSFPVTGKDGRCEVDGVRSRKYEGVRGTE